MLAIATIVIRIPAFFAEKSLVFDDGVFASSAPAMRNGELPFRDIFSSQGPVFLPLVWVADLVGLRTLDAPRLLGVAAGVLLAIAVYACARHVTSRGNALLAAGLVTTSGSVLWVTVPVNADGPSLALSVLAVAFALRYRDEPRLRTAVWMGLAAGGAVSIKALSVPALVIAGLIVLLSNSELRRASVTRPPPRGSRWRCTWWRRCRSGSPTCGSSRTPTTRTPGAPRPTEGPSASSSTRCGIGTSSWWWRSPSP